MRYMIEYLAQASIVHLKMPFALTLAGVTDEARRGSVTAKTLFGASGFRIRDTKDGEIVAYETFGA